jgi:hypothetical protein
MEVYAIRAREFSDAVARLGKHPQIERELLGLLDEIKRLRGLCDEAAEELERQTSRRELETSIEQVKGKYLV